MQFPQSLFWNFSLNFYQLPEVEKSCLSLQEEHQLNVNLILFCYWLALENHQQLSLEQWQQLISASLPWEEIIKPLRQSRKLIKHSPIAWPNNFIKETGNGISTIEINTEHMQQLSIEQAWQQMDTSAIQEEIEAIAHYNISQYLKAANNDVSTESIKNELEKLSKACAEYQTINKTIAL